MNGHDDTTTTPTRSALVTGGSSGIGGAVAAMLLADGYGVTICGRNSERLEESAARLGVLGDLQAVRADVTDENDVAELIRRHAERFGRLDVLVASAGAVDLGGVGNGDVGSLDAMLEANVRSTWRLIGAANPLLCEAGNEHGAALVVAVGSVLGRYGKAVTAGYSTSKGAVFALMQAVHDELSDRGVRATTIAPAFVSTPMTEPLAHLDREAMIAPDDVAEAVRFLTRLGPTCSVPEILMLQSHDRLLTI